MVLSIILRGTNWRKMPDFTQIVYQKAAITAVLSLFVWALWAFRDRINVAPQQQPMVIWLAFIALRILPFIAVYLVFDYDARSDVHMFYVSALDAYKLKLVYKDFDSAYSPVFAYLTALPLIFWNSPKAIILLLILIEGITLQLTFRLYRDGGGVHFRGDSPFHKALIYLFLPIPFVLSVLSGQEDLLMWLFGVICLLVWRERRDDLWVGIVLGIGMVVTKAILILTLIPVFFLVRNQIRYVLGLLIVGIPSLAIMYWLVGMEFLEPIQQANDPRTPNIWTILPDGYRAYGTAGGQNPELGRPGTDTRICRFLRILLSAAQPVCRWLRGALDCDLCLHDDCTAKFTGELRVHFHPSDAVCHLIVR